MLWNGPPRSGYTQKDPLRSILMQNSWYQFSGLRRKILDPSDEGDGEELPSVMLCCTGWGLVVVALFDDVASSTSSSRDKTSGSWRASADADSATSSAASFSSDLKGIFLGYRDLAKPMHILARVIIEQCTYMKQIEVRDLLIVSFIPCKQTHRNTQILGPLSYWY